MSVTLVFLHGRGQEFKDPEELVRTWRAGLAAGLAKAGAASVDDIPVVLPYYGNLLYQVTAQLARQGNPVDLESLPRDPGEPGPLHPYLTKDVGRIERQVIGDMSAAAGRPLPEEEGLEQVLSWAAARRALVWIARDTRVDQEIIKLHVRDVAVYLTRARNQVLELVRDAIPPTGPIVLITHSLGTVVGRDLLDDDEVRQRTTSWLTAGAPLGLDAIQNNLLTKGAHNPGVDWLNAYDVTDVVALGNPLRDQYGDPLRDIQVVNGDSPHSIERYLSHPEVAGPIGSSVRK